MLENGCLLFGSRLDSGGVEHDKSGKNDGNGDKKLDDFKISISNGVGELLSDDLSDSDSGQRSEVGLVGQESRDLGLSGDLCKSDSKLFELVALA